MKIKTQKTFEVDKAFDLFMSKTYPKLTTEEKIALKDVKTRYLKNKNLSSGKKLEVLHAFGLIKLV